MNASQGAGIESLPRVADFGYRTVAGVFRSDLADLDPYSTAYGLQLQMQYLYGGFTAEDGTQFVLHRKLLGGMTNGLSLLSNEGNERLRPVKQAEQMARGRVRRDITDDEWRWRDPLLNVSITDSALDYCEGDLLSIAGENPGSTVGIFVTKRDEQCIYLSRPFWATGTLQGKKVVGGMFLDSYYCGTPREWKESPVYGHQIAWMQFINRYDDGVVETGHLAAGSDGFGFAVVAAGDRAVVASGQVDVGIALDDSDFMTTALYDVGGDRWEFTGDPQTRLPETAKPKQGYRYLGQGGKTRNCGNTRGLQHGWAWVEGFSDRIRAEGLVTDTVGEGS